jgi:hypothetical protein
LQGREPEAAVSAGNRFRRGSITRQPDRGLGDGLTRGIAQGSLPGRRSQRLLWPRRRENKQRRQGQSPQAAMQTGES